MCVHVCVCLFFVALPCMEWSRALELPSVDASNKRELRAQKKQDIQVLFQIVFESNFECFCCFKFQKWTKKKLISVKTLNKIDLEIRFAYFSQNVNKFWQIQMNSKMALPKFWANSWKIYKIEIGGLFEDLEPNTMLITMIWRFQKCYWGC